MAIKKELRQEVFNKYGGKCAYCGCGLEKNFHVDHIEAYWHSMTKERCDELDIKKGADTIENMNPSCPRCNRWKGTFNIEQFRKEITEQVTRLNKYSNNYRLAKDYNLVSETKLNVIFYFETLNKTTRK